MEYRPLYITVISAQDLKDVNLFSKMDVYVVVSIDGDSRTQQKTPVDKDAGTNPKWNHTFTFTIQEATASQQTLVFLLKSDRNLGDRVIGEVHVPIKELLNDMNNNNNHKNVSYSVRLPNGKAKGSLDFSFKFGDKYTLGNNNPAFAQKGDEPVMAYPPQTGYAGSSSAYPPPPPPHAMYPPPPPPGNGYYPAYPPPPAAAPYGGYGGGYQPYGYVQQPQKPKKNKMGGMAGMGLGLGAGLLGGLLVGEVISDVADDAAFDCGGMDDGGFDF
ncbi:C2 domain-containing protein [Cephalotus follicularis]|uniref:C2 domain-containing protein n=1 Tax=Cephalotus follicularis TaxID=3775 RepID=A0A1Q3D3D9_CEPFO|nr:C2 domain-containing protein [Cephalotus follicularis]